MYKSFTARNFRCFDRLTIEPLERINLIAGKNNVGKTALLEALWLHHGYHNPELGVRIDVFRGLAHIKSDEFLWDLFFDFDHERPIELSSRDSDDKAYSLHIRTRERSTSRLTTRNGKTELFPATDTLGQETTQPVGSEVLLDYYEGTAKSPVQARAIAEGRDLQFERPPGIKKPMGIFLVAKGIADPRSFAERFADLEVERRKDEIVEILQIIEPHLQDLTMLYRGGVPMIYGDVGMKRLLPMPLMGDGIGRLLSLVVAMPQAQDGIVLVDEIENGLHYSVRVDVWKAIAAFTREFNVQLFATTHSAECIRAAHRAFEEDDQYDFRLHRLERIQDTIRAVTYDQDTLGAALETGLEIR
jgi:hypothetical protein